MRFLPMSTALLAQHSPRDTSDTSGTSGGSGCNLQAGLGPHLSSGAAIVLPSSSDWSTLQDRAAYPRVDPSYCGVVEVATENDVAATIKFANNNNLPFLTVSGAHGWTNDINKMKGGIQINMRKMNSVSLSSDQNTATIGGGALQDEATKGLAAKNRLAVTGLCACTSVIGPLMGSGHSLLQGQHGFAADNLNSARVVLANGTIVDVSSSSNPDLFWAMRGAGHNFGVVTSFNVNVYPTQPTEWSLLTFAFTEDKLEKSFDAINSISGPNGDQDPKLSMIGNFARNPAIDAKNPVILWEVFYQGSVKTAMSDVAALYAAGPVQTTNTTGINYANLYDDAGLGLADPVCRKDQNLAGYPASVPQWNHTAMRAAFGYFAELTADPVFNTSITLLENYGSKGVHTANASATSLPPEERDNAVLASPAIWWKGNDPANVAKAQDYGTKMQAAVNAGRPASSGQRHVYINYAAGGESIPDVYGHEDDRINRLEALKKQWDPNNRFPFYAPLTVQNRN